MKSKIQKTILAAAVLVATFTSCTKTGTQGPAGANGSSGPSLTGTLEAYVDLFDQYGDLVSPASGVYVTCPTKTGTDSTAASGMFTKSLTTGTYELDFAKTGYAAMKVPSINFVGGGTQYVTAHIQMTQVPSYTVSAIAAAIGTSTVNPAVSVTVTPSATDSKPRKIICFFGSSNTVSNTPGNYLGYQVVTVAASATSASVNLATTGTLYPLGAESGSTIYVIAYPIAYNTSASTYADMASGKTVFNNINIAGTSTVSSGVVVP